MHYLGPLPLTFDGPEHGFGSNNLQNVNQGYLSYTSSVDKELLSFQPKSIDTPQPLYNTIVGVHSINHVS